MNFNSLHFLCFFPIVAACYFSIHHRYRWMLLLAASYYFYMCWRVEYSILLISTTLVTYIAGLKMGRARCDSERKKYLVFSLILNLSLLFIFKYLNFMNESLNSVFKGLNLDFHVAGVDFLLPVGISFYTFLAIGYTMDVYRGEIKPETHLGKYSLFISFFPQLLAGPIARSTHLIPQFSQRHDFDYSRVIDGLRQMIWGFFKKLVIADRLAVIVNHVYEKPQDFSGIPLIVATVFFAYQIYCDFSGYSDIAIGAARIMGFDLMTNFRQPYLSKSISDFWRNWHISLSTWFKDYLYIPLGGNRVGAFRLYYNLMVVFLISGLWHGAEWTFVLWGALHGFYLIVSIATKDVRKKFVEISRLSKFSKILNCIRVIITFTLVCFAWVFFRAESLHDAFYIILHLFTGTNEFILNIGVTGYIRSIFGQLGVSQQELMNACLFIMALEMVQILQRNNRVRERFFSAPIWIRWSAYYALTGAVLFFGSFNSSQAFIYFQF